MEDDLEHRVANLLRFAMARAFDGAPHLLAILDAMPVCIPYVDSDLVYRFANRTYESWFRCRREDICDRTVPEVLGDKAFAVTRPYVERVLKGEPVQFEAEVDYDRAGPKRVVGTLVPDVGTDGEVRGYFALIQEAGAAGQAASRRRLRIAEGVGNSP